MQHIILIDPLSKLSIKKDSTLLLALSMKMQGTEVYLLFEEDFYYCNRGSINWKVYSFDGELEQENFYLKNFKLTQSKELLVDKNTCVHMRLEPPFDTKYLKYAWLLKSLEASGISVINSAQGLLLHNEKLAAYLSASSHLSYVGSSLHHFLIFCHDLYTEGHRDIIIKPLDLFQGIGVVKIALGDDESLTKEFTQNLLDCQGTLVAQPFDTAIYEGELRSIFFKGVELGTIRKVPQKGSYMANIAQGAQYFAEKLNDKNFQQCTEVAQAMAADGVDWIAFDILGESLSEVNITCPGLLVEVSNALKVNLAVKISEMIR